MSADRWRRVKDIFHAALERAPEMRAAFVIAACGSDASLCSEVERLVAAHDRAGSFIEPPPAPGPPPRQMSLSGRTVGRYEVGRLIGAGGMGEVYVARDTELGRQVALKIAIGIDADSQTRLRREAQHASHLNHPHICTIYEVGAADGQFYIVMEYLDGPRLSDVIPTAGLPVETVLRYGIHIADALAHAHRNGVTHRDLKAANIVITSEGRAKVLDFGLARRSVRPSEAEQSITAEGSVAGTLAYMAPELLRGERADARSDIWALGVVLYEMATGSRPFAGATGFEQSGAILHEPAAPLPARIPASLQQIVRRCLAKDSRERYSQANELRSALETAQAGVTGSDTLVAQVSPPSDPAVAPQPTPPKTLRKFLRLPRIAWIAAVVLAILGLTRFEMPESISTALRNLHGYSLLEEGRPEEAIREFEKNVEADPAEPNSYDSLAEAHLVIGAPDTAIEHYERALAIDPDYSSSRIGRAWAWGMLGRFDRAIADDPPDPLLKTLLLSRVGRYKEAEEILADQGQDESALLLASMLATERGDYASALKHVRSAEEAVAQQDNHDYLVLADLFGGTAAARYGDLKVAQARLAEQAKRYKATVPTEKRWHQLLAGEIALAAGNPQAALDAYAAGEPSRNVWPTLRDTALLLFANSLSFRDVPARAQAAKGDVDAAIQTYRRLLTAGPEQKWAAMYEPRYVLEIARLLTRKADHAGATQEYQRFLDFWKTADPGLPEVAEARKMVTVADGAPRQ